MNQYPCSYGHDWMMGGGWGWIGALAFWLILLACVVLVVCWSASQRRGRTSGGPPLDSPLDILKRRYAAGEIEREEFERKKRELS